MNDDSGNAAAMREALEKIYSYAQSICDYKDEPAMVCRRADLIERAVNAALAAPPRNCDVGTPEEQDARFGEFCVMRRTGSCAGCPDPVGGFTVANGIRECALVWAQMPYVAERKGEGDGSK